MRRARRWFERYLAYPDDREWAIQRRADVHAVAELLTRDKEAFEDEVWKRIDLKREPLKLPRLAAA